MPYITILSSQTLLHTINYCCTSSSTSYKSLVNVSEYSVDNTEFGCCLQSKCWRCG